MARFRTIPREFDALQLRSPVQLVIGKGRGARKFTGKSGDWLVTYDSGTQEIVTDDALRAVAVAIRENGSDPAPPPPHHGDPGRPPLAGARRPRGVGRQRGPSAGRRRRRRTRR